MLLLESIGQDIRYAIRAMRNSVGLTAVAILSLALGIGATIAIFSVIYALALRQLPVLQPDRLVGVEIELGNLHTYAEWELFRDRQDILSGVLAYNYFDAHFETSDPEGTAGNIWGVCFWRLLLNPWRLSRFR